MSNSPRVEALVPGEVEVPEHPDPEQSELMWRQIPDHMWDGQPGLQSFGPSGSDHRKPSFSRESVVTAKDSFEWHNENARSKSRGVWACSANAVVEAGTRSIDDSGTPVPPDEKRAPGHAYVDYRNMNKTEKNAVMAHLLMFALDLGQQHPK